MTTPPRRTLPTALLAHLLLTIIVCAGCSARGPAPGAVAAQWSSAIDWIGLAGRWSGAREYRVELVEFTDAHSGATHVVRYDIELAPGRLAMVAQTPLGLPLYEAVVAAGEVHTVLHMDRLAAVPVERTLADFVLANWPVDELAAAAEAAGYTMLQKRDTRQLLDPTGAPVVEVRPATAGTNGTTRVTHYDIPLELAIRTIERSAAAKHP